MAFKTFSNNLNVILVSIALMLCLKTTIGERKYNKTFQPTGHVMLFHYVGTKSHLNIFNALAEGLLLKGHHVTAAFYAPSKIRHENYSEILLPDKYVLINRYM